MAACRFRIEGQVQGVGFRYAMCQEARRLVLAGWVRNRRDGSVEAVAVGPTAALETLQSWAQRGPAAARVTRVEVIELSNAELNGIEPPIDERFRQAATV